MGEIYTGVKFEVVHGPEEKIEDPCVGELIRIGKTLADRGFCPANSGNLSFRRGEDFVITRAGSELGKLMAKDFVIVSGVDVRKRRVCVAGKGQPSSEAMMHRMIYDARPDVGGILHAHALELKNAVITEREFPYGTLEFARSAAELVQGHDLIILKNHGFVAVGRTVGEAFARVI